MNKNKILLMLLILSGLSACDDKLLNLESLTEPVDATFYANEQELDLALTGVYSTLVYTGQYGLPMPVVIDNSATDIGISRGFEGGSGFGELGAGSHSATSAIYQNTYSYSYKAIARANSLLNNMERAIEVVDPEKYSQIQAQALVIRAYYYMYLTELFGDVPLILEPNTSTEEALIPRSPKSEIVDRILSDLQTAAGILPNKWSDSGYGRITKGAALALSARIALYNERYDIAAQSANLVIQGAGEMGYALHPDYEELFSLAGEKSSEIILSMPFKDGFHTTQFPRSQGSRTKNGYSTNVPTQSMIDSYEGADGQPIDESAVYSPQDPFENRDPRLRASMILPGDVWAGQIFESHPDSVTLRNANGSAIGGNNNSRTVAWPAAFCGYMWKKYTIEEYQEMSQIWSDMDFIMIRYAEVLLIYAEAKIEMGQVDDSVLAALNRIRARAYGVDVSSTDSYPAVTTNDPAELREVVRRERKVELANEGFRLFDIRRWRIAEKVMPVTIYGQILDPSKATGIPQIDEDCFVTYDGIESQYDLNLDSRFPNALNRKFDKSRDYLCPIPQQEIDTYRGLGGTLAQNPGF